MYATPEDIQARYKEVYPILAGKDAEGRPDTAAVEQALAEAASEIDAILGTRFAVPVTPAPPVLRRIAVDLAVGALPRTGATEASMYERRAREACEGLVPCLSMPLSQTDLLGVAPKPTGVFSVLDENFAKLCEKHLDHKEEYIE